MTDFSKLEVNAAVDKLRTTPNFAKAIGYKQEIERVQKQIDFLQEAKASSEKALAQELKEIESLYKGVVDLFGHASISKRLVMKLMSERSNEKEYHYTNLNADALNLRHKASGRFNSSHSLRDNEFVLRTTYSEAFIQDWFKDQGYEVTFQ